MPVVSIPDKDMRIRFPDDMAPEEIERTIREEVYGGYVLPEAREIAQGLREEDERVRQRERSFFPQKPRTAPPDMGMPHTPEEEVRDIASQLGREATVQDVKEYAAYVPYLAAKALHGLTGWVFEPFQKLPKEKMSPIQRATTEALGGAEDVLETAAEYWKKATGEKDVEIPNATIGLNEDGSLAIQPAKPVSLRETLGTTAEFAGEVMGPIKGALRAGHEAAELTAKYARPFYRSIMRGMVGGALLGEGKKDETLQNMALFGVFEPLAHSMGKIPEVPRIIKESTPWRRMTIKERGLVLQSLDDMLRKNPNMTEAQILKTWSNPQWRREALERRMTPLSEAEGRPRAETVVRTPETGMTGVQERTGEPMLPASSSKVVVPAREAPTTRIPSGPVMEAGPPPAEQDGGVKEPWRMTREEYSKFRPLYTPTTAERHHRREILDALAKGKPVPEAVLAEYPDLAPRKPQAPARDVLPKKGVVFRTQTNRSITEKDPEWLAAKKQGDRTAAVKVGDRLWSKEKSQQVAKTLKDPENAVIISVPSTSRRNVLPDVLAERIAQDIGATAIHGAEIFRTLHEEESKNIPKTARWKHPREYELAEGLPVEKLGGREIVVVDDIFTSGGSAKDFIFSLADQGLQVSGVAGFFGDSRLRIDPQTESALKKAIRAAGLKIKSKDLSSILTRKEVRDIVWRKLRQVKTDEAKQELTQDLQRLLDRRTPGDVRVHRQGRAEGPSQRDDQGHGRSSEGASHRRPVREPADQSSRESVGEFPRPEQAPEGRKLQAEQKEAERRRRLARNARDFRNWVRWSGGIQRKDETWKGEIRDLTGKGGLPPWIFSKKARGIDEMTQEAINEGWLPPGATEDDFIEALARNPDQKPTDWESEEALDKLIQEEENRISQLVEELRNEGCSEDEIAAAIRGGEAEEASAIDERTSGEERPVDEDGFNLATGEFEEPVLTPEEPTPYEKAAALEKEGVVKFPEKSNQKVQWPKEGIKTVPGQQRGLFGPKKGESFDLFSREIPGARQEAKALLEGFRPIPEGKRRSSILKKAAKILEVPIRTGKFRTQRGALKASGIYKSREKVIRLARANDLETAIHEIGHHIETLLGLPGKMPPEVRAMAYEGAKDLDREGFAEFLRYYVTDPKRAREGAPDFYQTFEQALEGQPDVRDIITQARNAWNVWQQAPSVAKVHSFIQRGTSKRAMPTVSQVYTSVKDSLHPLQEAVKAAEEKGATVSPAENPYLMARLTRGWARKAEQYLKYQPFQYDPETGVRFSGKSLKEILKPIEKSGKTELLDTYLVAKRALHDPRIQKGFSGILSVEDFRQTVKELEPEFEETAKDLYEYSDQLLTFLSDSGRISKKTAAAIRSRNLFYAPLYRVMDWEAPLGGLSSKRFSKLFNPVKRLKGSSRDIYSPTESLLYNTYVTINAAERNRVGNALQKLAEKPGMGAIIEKIPPRIKPVRMTVDEALKSLTQGIADPMEKRAMADVLSSLPEEILQEMVTAFRPDYTPKQNEALFYKDGEPVLYEISPDLARAIGNINASDVGMLTRALSYPAKWLRAGATTYSLEFAIRNPLRDQMTAFIQTKYGFKPGYDVLRGLYHMVGKTDLWQRFNASGAAHSAIVSLDRNYLSKNLKDMIKKGSVKGIVRSPLELMQALSEYAEEATRVGEFARGLKKEGESYEALLKAGLAGREVSLDFARQGEAWARSANLISAFWNARMEGLDKMYRTFKENPVKAFSKAFLGVTLPSILIWYAQRDDPYYQELPAWRKTIFWNFVLHNEDGSLKHVISIPKPFEYGLIFGSIPESALDWAYSEDPGAFNETMKTFGETFNLVPIPTGLVPIAEWWGNRSWFFDRPIVPRGKEELVPVLQYGGHTTETAKLVAELMDKVPGLREVASPAKIENLIRGYTGGSGRLALEAGDALIKTFGIADVPPDPSMTLADIPGIRAFIARFPSANTRSIETFYKRYEDMNRKWESQKERVGVRGTGLRVGSPQKLQEYRTTATALTILRKAADQIYKSKWLDPEDKRDYLDNIYVGMANVARNALDKHPKLKPPKREAK